MAKKERQSNINVMEDITYPRTKSIYGLYNKLSFQREFDVYGGAEKYAKRIKNKYGSHKRYEEAYDEGRRNIERYANKYNSKVQEEIRRITAERETMRDYSVYTDMGKSLEGYHQTSDSVKNQKLRCKNENPYLYYGIEIEITFGSYNDYRGESEDSYPSFDEIIEEFDRLTHGIFCYERDCTVYNGFEIISRPLSFNAWHDPIIVTGLKDGFEYLKNMGALIDQPEGNGMHIHLSKRFFEEGNADGNTYNRCCNDMGYMVESLGKDFEIVANRRRTDYCQNAIDWYKENYSNCGNERVLDGQSGIVYTGVKMKRDRYSIPCNDHHRAVIHSGRTVELRFFRSTIDYKRVLANIELASSMANAARDDQIIGKTMKQILEYKKGQFTDYLLDEIHKKKQKLSSRKTKEEIIL